MSNANLTETANDTAANLSDNEQATANRIKEEARLAARALMHYVGAKYDRTRETRATAALIRKELNALGKGNVGPLAGCTFSVKMDSGSMYTAIDAKILSIPSKGTPIINGRWVEQEDSHKAVVGPRQAILSNRGEAMIKAVESVIAQYNYDKSDSMTDYHDGAFYTGTSFGPGIESAAIAEVRATLALLRQT